MDILKQVLPNDRKEAELHRAFNLFALEMASYHLRQANYEAVDKWIIEYRKSSTELAEMADKKYKYDRELKKFQSLIEDLTGEGIEIKIVRRVKYETSN